MSSSIEEFLLEFLVSMPSLPLYSSIMNKALCQQILRYWRDLEFFLPFDLDRVRERHSNAIPLLETTDLPWHFPEQYNFDPEKEYGYDLFFAPFLKTEIRNQLSERFPEVLSEIVPDPRELKGLSCFARVQLSKDGFVNFGDISISTLPWAISYLYKKKPLSLSAFDEFSQAFFSRVSAIEGLVANENGENDSRDSDGISYETLKQMILEITKGSKIKFFPDGLHGIIVPYALGKKKIPKEKNLEEQNPKTDFSKTPPFKRKVDILNSFYTRDLERAYEAIGKEDAGSNLLIQYLSGFQNARNRIDLLQEESKSFIKQILQKEHLPIGRWPADANVIPSLNQQLAINTYLSSSEGITAVNGPPGTGKTVMVRDIIAELVVQRATELAKLKKPEDAFQPGLCDIQIGTRSHRIRKLKKELRGYEIVIASNNNAAVENISKELPKQNNISSDLEDLHYLTPIATLYKRITETKPQQNQKEEESSLWGLPSIALGNSRNRQRFRKAAFSMKFHEDEKEKEVRIKEGKALTLHEWRAKSIPGSISFHQAKQSFIQKLKEIRTTSHIAKNSEYPSLTSTPLNNHDLQKCTPGISPELNVFRSELFQEALRLHEAWVREVPRLQHELWALESLIRSPQAISEEDAKRIWPLLFLIVPVVSTTLASVEKMFSPLPPGSIGNLLIDEAGQATPQSVTGAILRSKRALIIGDQQQLEPIVPIPQAIEKHFARVLSEKIQKVVSPLLSSAQTLADLQNRAGTYFMDEYSGDDALWVGIPLLIHRRCADPMFGIANNIAYNNLMIHAHTKTKQKSLLGESCWVSVAGKATRKQWVPEQGTACRKILEHLILKTNTLPDIFFISPFREVRSQLTNELQKQLKSMQMDPVFSRELRKRIGTVHTFQGKEADTVFLVLGCDNSSERSAEWAGEKPNLVNVAVTRARNFLYVIGDKNVWHNKGYCSDLEKSLPERSWQELISY